jgi:hypothetical protein
VRLAAVVASALEVLHARLSSGDLQLATAQKFTDLIREDIIWFELCRLNLLQSFKRRVVDSWCDRTS